MKIRFIIPKQTPSQNEYQRWHYHRQHKYKQHVIGLLQAQLAEIGMLGIEKPEGKSSVVIHRFCAGKRLDRGNFIGGCKPILDALTQTNIIRDDAEEFLEDRYEQHSAPPGKGWTEIEVWR